MATNAFRPVSTTAVNDALHRREIAEAVNRLGDGKHNAIGTFTLSTGTSTLLIDPRIGVQSSIVWGALSANAAGALGGLYVTGRADGTATLIHSTATATDRSYCYVIGG